MDYYAILGVKYGSSQEEIKKAFHALAKVHHPDKGGDPEKFKKISEAYTQLSKGYQGQPSQPRGHQPGSTWTTTTTEGVNYTFHVYWS